MSRVDAVIATDGRGDLALKCVASLVASADADGVRCIVVDNGSRGHTAAVLRERYGSTTVIESVKDRGYAASCNAGARLGGAPYILFLNDDVEARPGAVARLVSFMDASPDYVAAGGRLLDAGTDRTQVGFTVRALPRLSTQVALLLGFERYWPSNPVSRRQLMLDFDYEKTQDAPQPAGACVMCRRSDFEAIAGFDEGFFYWFEDVDLARRLLSRGRIAYVHDAPFEHIRSATLGRWPRPAVIETRYRSLFRYFNRHRPPHERVALRAVVGLLSAIRGLAWLPFERGRARAYFRVLEISLTGGSM